MIKHLQFISGCGKENYEQPVKKITALYCRLSHDDEQEKIGTIIVKDHSRLRRNRLVVGQLLEKDFDRINVRYIAIMDNIDTANGISDFVPMQDLFNEWHAKNTSDKVRQEHKSESEECIPQ